MSKASKREALPTIQNVVSQAVVGSGLRELDLLLIASKMEGCRYNRRQFPAVIMRKTQPRCTILLFKSGRMIAIGSQS